MSKAYVSGFTKAAAAHGVDPVELAKYAITKQAQDGSDLWTRIKNMVGDATAWWNDPKNQAWRPLIGAGVGSAIGTGVGSALKGKKGLRSGAIIGALAGGAGSVNWSELAKTLGKLSDESKKRSEEAARLAKEKADVAAAEVAKGNSGTATK